MLSLTDSQGVGYTSFMSTRLSARLSRPIWRRGFLVLPFHPLAVDGSVFAPLVLHSQQQHQSTVPEAEDDL